jgi:outer membrane protein
MKRTFVGTAALVLVLATASLGQSAPATHTAATPPPAPAATASTTSAAAASTGGVKVGIIDIQQAIVATNEGARDFEALQKKFEPKKNELAGLNTDVENLKKQLNTQGDKMNEEARANLVKSIETKQKALQRQVEDAQNEYQQQQNEIAQRILQKMAPVIDKYAKANNYGLLFDSSNPWPQGPLLWATAGVDLTKTIVDAYNSQSGVAPPATRPSPAGAPGASTGKPTGSVTPPAGTTKPATSASTGKQ